MAETIDYYYSHLSPWSYLGHERLIEAAKRAGATINFKPIDAGKVFAASGGLPLAKRPIQRRNYRLAELRRWRDEVGIPLNLQPKFHPAPDRCSAQIAIAALLSGFDIGALSLALMRGCWAEDKDLADEGTVAAIATAQGMDGAALLQKSKSDDVIARFEKYTEDAIEAGVFGMPWYQVDGEPFWGQDRLFFVEKNLGL
ncbi:2-hydroxychromene-2-carboxylate isomerase [Hwanghaeella sp.]|uniref:2-hydroxychromene-2-carboxylate isomerase n=1 Tax=Hwanghaeella sp. TaxID=2605943 RepID=UPI003CCBAF0B